MTEIEKLLDKKFVNKEEISRRTSISTSRLSKLSLKRVTRLRTAELYHIALDIDVDHCEVLKEKFKDHNSKTISHE